MIALVAHGSSTLSAYTEAVRELACEILELIAEGLGGCLERRRVKKIMFFTLKNVFNIYRSR